MLIFSCLNDHMISLSWLKPDWYSSEQHLVKFFFFEIKSFFYLHGSCIPRKFRNYIRMQNINFLFVCKKELKCRLRRLQTIVYLCASLPLTAVQTLHNSPVVGPPCPVDLVIGASKNPTVNNLYNYMHQPYITEIPIQIFECLTRCRTILHCVGPSHQLQYLISYLHPFYNSTVSQSFWQLKISPHIYKLSCWEQQLIHASCLIFRISF